MKNCSEGDNVLLIIDLEATCWHRDDNRTKEDREIIEIGGVLLMDSQIQPRCRDDYVPSFSVFVKPVVHPQLTDFCKNLTSIQQSDVDGASYFSESLTSFLRWVEAHIPTTPFRNVIWGSWGVYDRNQMMADCNVHGTQYPFGRHWNIKQAYSRYRGVKKGYGLKKALKQLDIPFEGVAHRGVDDAIMISKIVREVLGQEYHEFL